MKVGRPRINTERDRRILHEHWDGKSMRTLAKEYGLTHQRIWQIVQEEERRIRDEWLPKYATIEQARTQRALFVRWVKSQADDYRKCFHEGNIS